MVAAPSRGFRLAFDGPIYRSAYRYAAPAWSAAGLLRWPRASLRSPYVVGTSLMASRYGLAVPLGDRSCAASTSTSLVSSPSVRVDGVHVLMKFLPACAVTPSQVPVGAVRVRELDVLRAPVHQPGRQVRPRPPAWTCFGWPWRCTRSPRRCSATRSGPSPPLDGPLDAPDVSRTWPRRTGNYGICGLDIGADRFLGGGPPRLARSAPAPAPLWPP